MKPTVLGCGLKLAWGLASMVLLAPPLSAQTEPGAESLDTCLSDCVIMVNTMHARVDQSYSPIAIGTSVRSNRDLLAPMQGDPCGQFGICGWIDESGVKYLVSDEDSEDAIIIGKIVDSEQFHDLPIAALGIGTARGRRQVLRQLSAFLGRTESINCERADYRTTYCEVEVQPGMVGLSFDPRGQLMFAVFLGIS